MPLRSRDGEASVVTLRYTERDGSSGNDALIGSAGTITFGLQGNDTLTGSVNPINGEILSGGVGADTYIAAPGTTITIADMGDGSPNTLIATGITLNSSSS